MADFTDLPPGAVVESAPMGLQGGQPDEGLSGSVTDESTYEVTDLPTTDLPEGATIEQQGGDFFGLPRATNKDEMLVGLRKLTELGAPSDTLRQYIRSAGFTPTEETDRWLDTGYSEGLQTSGGRGTPVDWKYNEAPKIGGAGSAWSGLKSGALFGFDDEIQALGGAAGNSLGTALGLNESDASFGDIYDQILEQNRQHKNEAYRQNPFAYGAGFAPGALLTAPLAWGSVTRGTTTAGRVANAAVAGGVAGAASDMGNYEGDGGLAGRVAEAPMGFAKGAGMGVATYPIAAGVSNVVGRAAAHLSPAARRETSGLDALDWRAPQDPAAMRALADEMEAAGVPARLTDVVDESGRGVIRDAASKMTPAREAVARHADAVAADAQDRVAQQAYTHIAPDPRTARAVAKDLTAQRGAAMDNSMRPIRGDAVPMTPQVADILATREGQAALRGAEGLLIDPADRAVVRQLIKAAREHAKGPVDPEDAFRAEVKGWDDLPEVIKGAYRQQRPELMQQEDPFAGINLTVDLADKIARAMKGRASKTPGLERVASQFGDTIRGEARAGSPAYDSAIDAYGAQSKVIDAATGEGRFADTNFLDTPADPFTAAVRTADSVPAPGTATSEMDALRLRARDQVVERATAGSGQNAPSTARAISRGSAQQAKNEALLGPDAARNLEKSMGFESQRVSNTRFIDPRSGSPTFGRAQDAIVDGAADAMASAATGGKWAVVRTAVKWLQKGGIRNVDAERLARQAVSEDPAELRAAIDYLEKRGMKRDRAERFVSSMTSALAARPATQSDRKSQPPNSVRAIMRQSGRN